MIHYHQYHHELQGEHQGLLILEQILPTSSTLSYISIFCSLHRNSLGYLTVCHPLMSIPLAFIFLYSSIWTNTSWLGAHHTVYDHKIYVHILPETSLFQHIFYQLSLVSPKTMEQLITAASNVQTAHLHDLASYMNNLQKTIDDFRTRHSVLKNKEAELKRSLEIACAVCIIAIIDSCS
jgi:hypothetical protein